MSEVKLIQSFKKARMCSVPIIAIESSDVFATIRSIVKEKEFATVPIVSWDIINGFVFLNPVAKKVLNNQLDGKEPDAFTNPSEALCQASKFSEKSIVFFLNAHRYIGSESTSQASVGQAISNLRDKYKQNERTLVLLGPSFILPEELVQDVVIMNEPLPDEKQLGEIVTTLYKSVELPEPESLVLTRAVDSLRGLSAFAAEQATAMSMQRTGVNLEQLWERKRKQVDSMPGLSIYRGKETFKDVCGISNIKSFVTKLFTGDTPPTLVLFIDEIEKQLAGTAGDLSGVSQEMHGQFLSWMADFDIMALLMVGHPGCSKSYLTKATGGEFNAPTIIFNLSEVKGSLVGQSTAQLKADLKFISAIGRPMLMATCNSVDSLSPELKSRFELGTFFFDLPGSAERRAVWSLYTKKFGIEKTCGPIPVDEGWTPREIRGCCNIAWRLKCTLVEAASYIVPVSKSAPERIEQLRRQASGRFLNANGAGVYNYENKMFNQEEISATRKLNFSGSMGEA